MTETDVARGRVLAAQLDGILQDYEGAEHEATYDRRGMPVDVCQRLVTRSVAAIHRIAGATSVYARDAARIEGDYESVFSQISPIIGVVGALRDDLATGCLETLTELIHAEIFADFLDMASHLLESGYKDAAAVVCGTTLEGHLGKLCSKYGIAMQEAERPKTAGQINAELAKAGAYSKLDEKNVTAWLDLRNRAAHGKYASYDKDIVKLVIAGVRNFTAKTPA